MTGFRYRLGCALALAVASTCAAQIPIPLDVEATLPILDENGEILQGNNPVRGNIGLSVATGGLIQIIEVGDDMEADLPAPDGSPGDDDAVIATTMIGAGISPNNATSGLFSVYFPELPSPEGGSLYARVFNASTVAEATHWAQSATFTPSGSTVFNVNELGLAKTSLPKGSDPLTTDSDGDSQTDYEELVANTDANDAGDRFSAGASYRVGANNFDSALEGKAGRIYKLFCSTNDLAGPMTWLEVAVSGQLSSDQNLVLSDPNPPEAPFAFYRLEVTMP